VEAATAILRDLPARRRQRSFEYECERLRPLGEAFVLRRFGDTLNRADAEDVVADVLIRLHRRVSEGYQPENLRAVFFTSVRNAAIDLLRSRSAKPTVALEAAASAPAQGAAPPERAESDEDAVRLQEALARMRENYREAILLRFGLGLTVPEIAQHLSISLPAAKKLVLRSTRQVKDRLAAIEGAEFCPEMRAMARRSLLEKQASGLASESEAEILRTHFQHCGSCKSFLASLHGALHELGSAAVIGLTVGDRLGRVGVLDHVARWATSVTDVSQAAGGRVRHLGFKLTGAFQSADSPASGILASTSQKIAAVCTAGAATTATCLLTGAVGPGIGVSAPAQKTPDPPPQVRTVPSAAAESPPPAPAPDPEPAPAPSPSSDSSPAPAPDPTPVAPAESVPAPAPVESEPTAPPPSEFGIEGGSSSASSPAPAPTPSPTPSASSGGSFGGGGGSESSASHSSGGGSIGFQG
jgi:RNA polymerase sigma factor (sigma-70 family)